MVAGSMVILAALGGTAAAQQRPSAAESCEGCHARERDATFELHDGTEVSAWVDLGVMKGSVHGEELACVDCHRWQGGYPHKPVTAATRADYRRAQAGTCNRCHYAHFTRVLDGIHYKELESGNAEAPSCVDCHGAHDVVKPSAPRTAISQKCATCHAEEAATYQRSVHGAALARGDVNVPVCTDCHGAHDIVDPRTRDFHASSYLMCARCHGDDRLMKKYDLSSNVLTTYLDDFHGSSNVLYSEIGYAPERPMATCADCHGAHDAARFDRSGGEAAVRRRVADMCRSCHRDASEEFASAWLSHSSPTLARTPLVWAVTWGYRVLIPFMMLGLIMHILIDLWRLRTHGGRKGKS
jgi:hypothetical protein